MRDAIAKETVPEGYELVSLRGNYGTLFRTLLYFIALTPPGEPDSVTIKVREKSTGTIKTVTSRDERTAREKLAVGVFD